MTTWSEHIKSLTNSTPINYKPITKPSTFELCSNVCYYCNPLLEHQSVYDYSYDSYDPYDFVDVRHNTSRHNGKRFWYRHNNINTHDIIGRRVTYTHKQEFEQMTAPKSDEFVLINQFSDQVQVGDRVDTPRTNSITSWYTGRIDFNDVPGRDHLRNHYISSKRDTHLPMGNRNKWTNHFQEPPIKWVTRMMEKDITRREIQQP